MGKITVLHLSDFHWSTAHSKDQGIVVQALQADLLKMQAEAGLKPDLVLFSGDLVQAGEQAEAFDQSYNAFLLPVLNAVGQPPSRLFIAPGNHDIARSEVRSSSYIEKGLQEELRSVEKVNAFLDQKLTGETGVDPAFARIRNFDIFMSRLEGPIATTDNSVLRTYNIEIDDLKIGIACFNTAWRAAGEGDAVDKGVLLLGERCVDQAIRDLETSDVRIAMFHHPLGWLSDFDEFAVTSRLYAEFELLAFGHAHRVQPELRSTGAGTAVLSQSGSIFSERAYYNGYQYVVVDTDSAEIEIIARTWFDTPRRAFDTGLNALPNGAKKFEFTPRGNRPSYPEVERFLREARPIIRKAATDQIVLAETGRSVALDAKEAFVCPPLTLNRRKTGEATSEPSESSVTAEELLRSTSNFMVVGTREAGKSSLAHYLAVLCAEGASDRPRIPFIVDYRSLTKNAYGFRRAAGAYFGATTTPLNFDSSTASGNFLILIDNYSGNDAAAKQQVEKFLESVPLCRVICFVDATPGSITLGLNAQDSLPAFQAVHIGALPRRSIRQLSARWCEQSGVDGLKAYDTVMGQLRSSGLPRTGYIVTLLLWAVHQDRKFERINEAALLANVIDYLLGRADFTQAVRGVFDSASKEITLRELAKFVHAKNGVAPTGETITFLDDFFKDRGLDFTSEDILQQLVSCGILEKRSGLVAFKYRCFQDYFMALHLRNDGRALSEALSGLNFVGFARELDILSGLRREADDIIQALADAFDGPPPQLNGLRIPSFEEMSSEESAIDLSPRRLEQIRAKEITSDQIDELLDETDKQLNRSSTSTASISAKPSDVSKAATPSNKAAMTWNEFAVANDLFGRVIRNAEFSAVAIKKTSLITFLRNTTNQYLIYIAVMTLLWQKMKENGFSERTGVSEEILKTIRYLVDKILIHYFNLTMREQIASASLLPTMRELLTDSRMTTSDRLFLNMIVLDAGDEEWSKSWTVFVKDHEGDRFVLDILLDKLWWMIHERVMTTAERASFVSMAERISKAFRGRSAASKPGVVGLIRSGAGRVDEGD